MDEDTRTTRAGWQLALNAVGVGAWEVDLSTGELGFSSAIHSIFDLPDGATRNDFVSRIHPDDRDRVVEQLRDAQAAGGEYQTEFRIVRRDGSLRWVSTKGTFVRDSEGRPIRRIGITQDITERRQFEETLRASEATLRSFYDSVPMLMGIVETSEDDILHISDNAAARAYFGVSSTASRWSGEMGVPLADRRIWLRHYREAQLTGRPARWEFPYSRDGVPRILSVNISFIEIAASGRPRFSYAGEDVTLDRQAEELLRESEERFRVVFEQAAVGLARVGMDGRWLQINQRLCDILGYTRDELLNLTFGDITHPEDLAAEWEHANSLLRGEIATYSMEKRYIGKSGDSIWVNLTASLVRDAAGVPRYFISIVEDISARRQAENAVRVIQERLQRALSSARLGLWDVELSTGNLSVSDNFESLYGLQPGDVRHLNDVRGCVHPDDLQMLKTDFENAVRERSFHNARFRVIWPDGTVHWLRSQGSAVFDDDEQQPTRISGAVLDVTEQRTAELALQDLTANLEGIVEDRTRQLEDANKELEAFSYSVSHDLRAPLRSIEGFGQMLLQKYTGRQLDETGVDYIRRMARASERMGQLIEDLLRLSRISRSEIRRGPVKLSELAASIVQELRARSPERVVDVSIQPDVMAVGDASLLRVALENLLGNAWKYTGRRERAVIEFGVAFDTGERVFFVKDNGAGFDMKHANHLFAPFQRLHRASEFEGTGVGLATVQRIVHRHGGRIWATAEKDKGAEFYFTLGGSDA